MVVLLSCLRNTLSSNRKICEVSVIGSVRPRLPQDNLGWKVLCTHPNFEQQTLSGQLPICDHSFPNPGSQYDLAPQLLTQISLAQSRRIPYQSTKGSHLTARLERTVWTNATKSKLGATLVPFAWVACVAAEFEVASALTSITAVIFGCPANSELATAP